MKRSKILFSALLLALPFVGAHAQSLAGKRIYINPGHGGYEAVATTPIPGQFGNGYRSDGSAATDRWVSTIPYPNVCEEGVWESKHNLWRGLELCRLLEAAGAEVTMSRTTNNIEDDRILMEIGEEATASGADLFISIHTNASDKNYVLVLFRGADPVPGQTGFNITDPLFPESKEAGEKAWRRLHDNNLTCWQARKGENDVYAVSDSAFYAGWNNPSYHLGVLRKLFIPGYLAECSFHDYKPEAHRLLNPDYSNLIAFQLYTAICDYFNAPLPTTGIIAGAVKDSQRILRDPLFLGATFGDHDMYLPLNGAKVVLTGNGVTKEYITDNFYNGMFYFPDLTPGTYHISVSAEGYEPYEGDVVCEAAKSRGPIVLLDDPTYDPTVTAEPNIYASELKAVDANTVQFTLNGDATNVVVNLIKNDEIIRTISLGARPKGVNTVEMEGLADLTEFASGDYEWSITAEGVQLTNFADAEPGQVSLNGDPLLEIANTRGVSIDNNPESPFFGRIYATSVAANAKEGARLGTGLYILNAACEDVTGQGGTPYAGGENWSGNSGPYRPEVAPNGDVYICDWTDSHSGVWVMNPAKPNDKWRPVFGGARNGDGLSKNSAGVQIHGSIPGLFITGTGEETTLYTIDEDFVSSVDPNAFVILSYKLGTSTDPWDVAPTREYNVNSDILKNGNQDLAYDGRGGAWICQYRYQADAYPCAMHYNLTTGDIDYTSVVDGKESIFNGSYPVGGMGVSPDGKYLAIPNSNEVIVTEVKFDSNGVPSLEYKWSIGSTYGTRPFDADFDVAGNLYVAYNDNGGGIGIWSLPKEDNSYTTKANDKLNVVTSAGVNDVTNDGNDIVVEDKIVSAGGDIVTVYNAMGVEVGRGASVSLIGLTGVYVATTATKTVKIAL
ncbi:MAG: N-acetylmuramoyl-L-alanine amidase [Muribaculaceae bacterium]|nr:N-acetylmuramoyl-L-alanine amidase [Muribaculaceae bacterium]